MRASLVTPLDSGTTKHGAPVQALVSKPLFDGDHLILPQGTLLNGSVLQVRPAGHLKRNGQLRISFHELVPPNGSSVRVDTTIEGIQTGEAYNAQARSGRRRQSDESKVALCDDRHFRHSGDDW